MSENEVEIGHESSEEAKQEVAKKPKKTEKAATNEPPAPAKAEKGKKATTVDDVISFIKDMSVLELSQLVKALETEFGVSAAPVVTATAASAGTAEAAPAEEEKTEFTVILKNMGANKISVIKAVRELTTLGLKESKDLVESAPAPVKEGVNKDEAATMKQKLEAAGATVEIT